MSDLVALRVVKAGFGHLWAMYAVFWFASGHYGCAAMCAGLSVLIFYP